MGDDLPAFDGGLQMHRGVLVRLTLAAALAGLLLPQVVLTGGSFGTMALVGTCAIGFAAGLLVRTPRWLALIPVAAAFGLAIRYVAAIDTAPYGSNAGVPAASLYALVAFVAAL